MQLGVGGTPQPGINWDLKISSFEKALQNAQAAASKGAPVDPKEIEGFKTEIRTMEGEVRRSKDLNHEQKRKLERALHEAARDLKNAKGTHQDIATALGKVASDLQGAVGPTPPPDFDMELKNAQALLAKGDYAKAQQIIDSVAGDPRAFANDPSKRAALMSARDAINAARITPIVNKDSIAVVEKDLKNILPPR